MFKLLTISALTLTACAGGIPAGNPGHHFERVTNSQQEEAVTPDQPEAPQQMDQHQPGAMGHEMQHGQPDQGHQPGNMGNQPGMNHNGQPGNKPGNNQGDHCGQPGQTNQQGQDHQQQPQQQVSHNA